MPRRRKPSLWKTRDRRSGMAHVRGRGGFRRGGGLDRGRSNNRFHLRDRCRLQGPVLRHGRWKWLASAIAVWSHLHDSHRRGHGLGHLLPGPRRATTWRRLFLRCNRCHVLFLGGQTRSSRVSWQQSCRAYDCNMAGIRNGVVRFSRFTRLADRSVPRPKARLGAWRPWERRDSIDATTPEGQDLKGQARKASPRVSDEDRR